MNKFDIKRNNRKKVYAYIRDKGFATKQDIAYNLNLSLPTVTEILKYLIKQGLITADRKITKKTSGRNPIAYSYIPDGKVAIGMDVTRNHIKSVIVDLDGKVVNYNYRKQPYERSDEYLRLLGEEVTKVVDSIQLDSSKILGVAIAVPGLVSNEDGYIFHGKVIDNYGMSREDFSKYIPYPTRLIHDSYASVFSEMWFSEEIHNAFYISLCNSVGGAVLLNDSIYMGDGLYCGEIGHLNIYPETDKYCYCGKKGCFDIFCNAEVLSKHTDDDLGLFFDLLKKGDKEIEKVWDEYLYYLAIAISDVRMLFGCKVIIGGYVGAYIKEYMDQLYKKVDERNPLGDKAVDYLIPCKNDIEAVAVGAALCIIDEYLNNFTCESYSNNILEEK